MILVFGQQIEDVVKLTWQDVDVTDDLVAVCLGGAQITLPEPREQPWRQLAGSPAHDLTAAHLHSDWIFRGIYPGRHLNAASLRATLRAVLDTRAARLGTLHELTKLTPVAILAETLGHHPSTIDRHSIASGAAYADYVGAIAAQGHRES